MGKILKYSILSALCIVVIGIILYSTGLVRGYYYDTHLKVGEERVYSYNEITFSKPKCVNQLFFYEDEDYEYYISKSGCDKEQYYLKEDGKYIDLQEAIDLGVITPQQLLNSELKIIKEEK